MWQCSGLPSFFFVCCVFVNNYRGQFNPLLRNFLYKHYLLWAFFIIELIEVRTSLKKMEINDQGLKNNLARAMKCSLDLIVSKIQWFILGFAGQKWKQKQTQSIKILKSVSKAFGGKYCFIWLTIIIKIFVWYDALNI